MRWLLPAMTHSLEGRCRETLYNEREQWEVSMRNVPLTGLDGVTEHGNSQKNNCPYEN